MTQSGSLLLGAGLLYLALRNVNLSEIQQSLIHADYRYLLPLFVVVIASHLLRAWRWVILLDALPEHRTGTHQHKRHSIRIAFYSLMIGYMVNYAAPRLGEIARSANVTAQENTRFSSVLGTVVAERALDVVSLVIALLSVLLLFRDEIAGLGVFTPEAVGSYVAAVRFEYYAAGLAVLLLLLGSAFLGWRLYRNLRRKRSKIVQQRVRTSWNAFKGGLVTLFRTRRPIAITVITIVMWGCYLFMAHIPFAMLGMTETYNLTLLTAWAVMVIGSLGVVVPSPGGIGSYHYITIQTLVLLFAVSEAPAASYAVLTHAAQMILYTLLGFIFLLIQGANIKSLTKPAREPETEIT